MKKIISFALAFAIILSLAPSVFAADTGWEWVIDDPKVQTLLQAQRIMLILCHRPLTMPKRATVSGALSICEMIHPFPIRRQPIWF